MKIKLQEGQKVIAENGDVYEIEVGDMLQENTAREKQLEVLLYKRGLNGKSISIILNILRSSNDLFDIEESLYSSMKKKLIPYLDDDTLDLVLSYSDVI